jgi:multiple sugar transport system substrate-binding protein
MGLDLIYGPQFEAADQLTDITEYFEGDPHIATASPGHVQVGTYEGRLYGVPLYADVSALFYNKDLFRQAGLDPDSPPTSLAQLREYAEKIDALGDDIYGYYIPGSCAGCNIFTIAPLIWASGGKVESAAAGDEALVGENIPEVLQWLRDMHNDGLINPANRGETGETFHLQFGSGQYGMMGTGNFNIFLAREQNPEMDFGISLLPGLEEGSAASFIGGDLVVIPRGSERVEDAVRFMRWLLSDPAQVEVYGGILNMTTRTDMGDNPYFREEPLIQDVAAAIAVGQTPYTLTFFEQINSPQGPWLQMLQRVYYTDDSIDQIITDAKAQMLDISNQ